MPTVGVKPLNQTDFASSEVPVLPATGRPTALARDPVPPAAVTCCMASMTSAATSRENASTTLGTAW